MWFFFGIVVVALVLSAVFRFLTPKTSTTADNNWQGVVPGKTDANTVFKMLGQPANTVETERGTTLEYASAYPALPHEVLVDRQGEVEFIKEYIDGGTETVDVYIKKFGQPDMVLFAPEISRAVQAHVFLNHGVVVIAHQANGVIEQKWYFEPTTSQAFMTAWGAALETQDTPEAVSP